MPSILTFGLTTRDAQSLESALRKELGEGTPGKDVVVTHIEATPRHLVDGKVAPYAIVTASTDTSLDDLQQVAQAVCSQGLDVEVPPRGMQFFEASQEVVLEEAAPEG